MDQLLPNTRSRLHTILAVLTALAILLVIFLVCFAFSDHNTTSALGIISDLLISMAVYGGAEYLVITADRRKRDISSRLDNKK